MTLICTRCTTGPQHCINFILHWVVEFCHHDFEYKYTRHNRHFDLPSVTYESASQSTQLGADVLEYFPAPQSVHATDPMLSLYLPGTQPVQSRSFPVQPALQTQEEMCSLRASDVCSHHTTGTLIFRPSCMSLLHNQNSRALTI